MQGLGELSALLDEAAGDGATGALVFGDRTKLFLVDGELYCAELPGAPGLVDLLVEVGALTEGDAGLLRLQSERMVAQGTSAARSEVGLDRPECHAALRRLVEAAVEHLAGQGPVDFVLDPYEVHDLNVVSSWPVSVVLAAVRLAGALDGLAGDHGSTASAPGPSAVAYGSAAQVPGGAVPAARPADAVPAARPGADREPALGRRAAEPDQPPAPPAAPPPGAPSAWPRPGERSPVRSRRRSTGDAAPLRLVSGASPPEAPLRPTWGGAPPPSGGNEPWARRRTATAPAPSPPEPPPPERVAPVAAPSSPAPPQEPRAGDAGAEGESPRKAALRRLISAVRRL